jgi:hypothetical protein
MATPPVSSVPRPSRYSDEINHQVVEAIYPKVLKWLQESGDDTAASDAEGIKKDLFRAIDSAIGDDSYQIMKVLDDRCYWEVDATLQEVLERVSFLRFTIYEEIVAKWVEANGIVPFFVQGAPVEFTRARETVVGEILSIDFRHGTYAVNCPSLGHVKEGLGTHATILPFEEVRPQGADHAVASST